MRSGSLFVCLQSEVLNLQTHCNPTVKLLFRKTGQLWAGKDGRKTQLEIAGKWPEKMWIKAWIKDQIKVDKS